MTSVSRRKFLEAGTAGLLGTAGLVSIVSSQQTQVSLPPAQTGGHEGHSGLSMPGVTGDVDHAANGFNPTDLLTDFDYGKVSTLPNGQTLREYRHHRSRQDDRDRPRHSSSRPGRTTGASPARRSAPPKAIASASTSSTAPPTRTRCTFTAFTRATMDGVYEAGADRAARFTYEFDAEPFGLHLYHCHVAPLAKHIAKGLYGAFIIDPKAGRPQGRSRVRDGDERLRHRL